MNQIKIGVVGYSDESKFNNDVVNAMIVVADAIKQHRYTFYKDLEKESVEYVFVSGLTDLGIPSCAYNIGKYVYDAKTVGIACSKAKEYPCFPVDETHIIGDNWGDESAFFLGYIDSLIRVGGGNQSFEEVKEFKRLYPNKPVTEVNF